MNYELAKELKDAGFPSQCWEITECVGAKCNMMTPTLSELIEECGEKYFRLWHRDDMWSSMGAVKLDGKHHRQYGEGKTPEIAVARLWLALNKK